MRRLPLPALALLLLMLPGQAGACTLCHSDVAALVRALVFGPLFWRDLVALLLPAPALVAGVVVTARWLR